MIRLEMIDEQEARFRKRTRTIPITVQATSDRVSLLCRVNVYHYTPSGAACFSVGAV